MLPYFSRQAGDPVGGDGGWELDEFRAALARHDVGFVVAGPRFAALRYHHALEAGVPDDDGAPAPA